MISKTCIRCSVEQPIENFYKNKATKDGKHYYCKDCVQIDNKKRVGVKREKIGNHDPRPSSLEWAQTIIKQDGKCALCDEETKRLVADHNHETKEFRGALCDSCNIRLAKLEREEDWTRRAYFYLGWQEIPTE